MSGRRSREGLYARHFPSRLKSGRTGCQDPEKKERKKPSERLFLDNSFADKEKYLFLHSQTKPKKGRLAEWLGSGLQNRPQQFESATDLVEKGKRLHDACLFSFHIISS